MKKLLAVVLAVLLAASAVVCASGAAVFKGDLDGNGKVLAGEARQILRMSAKLDPQPDKDSDAFRLADVDGDGKLLAKDARTALRMSARLEPLIPIEEPHEEPAEKTSIDVCLATEPDSLDPALSSASDCATILAHLFSGLAKWTADEEGRPALMTDAAVSLPEGEVNGDGSVTYTYTLRDGLKWTDGRPVTAQDFVFAWNRAASPATNADYGYLFEPVDGFGAMWALDEDDRPVNPDAKLNVEAPDDRTLTVTLAHDVPYWNELLAFPAFFPVREDVAAKEGWADEAATYVSNGLYKMTGWVHNSVVTLTKNDAHPNADRVTMDEINFRAYPDEETALAKFASGEWSMLDDIPGDPKAIGELYPDALRTIGVMGTYYAEWNVNFDLLPAGSGLTGAEAERANAEIRRALSLLIDRRYITEEITAGGQAPASSFVALGMTDADGSQFCRNAGHADGYAGYYDVSAAAYEGNRAQAIGTLKKYYAFDASTGQFTDFPAITYIFNESTMHRRIAENIANAFASVGVRTELDGMGWNEFLVKRGSGDFALARGGWLADFNDPITFLDMWTSYAGNNDCGFGRGDHGKMRAYDLDLTPYGIDMPVERDATWSDTYDVLIGVISGTKDRATRYKLMHLAEDMLMETGCVTPIYFYTDVFMIDPHVRGFFANPLGLKYFMYTTIEK